MDEQTVKMGVWCLVGATRWDRSDRGPKPCWRRTVGFKKHLSLGRVEKGSGGPQLLPLTFCH